MIIKCFNPTYLKSVYVKYRENMNSFKTDISLFRLDLLKKIMGQNSSQFFSKPSILTDFSEKYTK